MLRERTLEIANHFMQFSNPTGWDGAGRKRPPGFTVRTRTYAGWHEGWLRIRQYKESGLDWCIRCQLVDRKTCTPVRTRTVSPINSVEALAGCLFALCEDLHEI